jgi:hypothetical protein
MSERRGAKRRCGLFERCKEGAAGGEQCQHVQHTSEESQEPVAAAVAQSPSPPVQSVQSVHRSVRVNLRGGDGGDGATMEQSSQVVVVVVEWTKGTRGACAGDRCVVDMNMRRYLGGDGASLDAGWGMAAWTMCCSAATRLARIIKATHHGGGAPCSSLPGWGALA